MGQRIPDETVEAVRQSVDIVDVIGDYVQLKKQGKNHFGLCPFHGENTPSFSVSEDKQIFHCFGCGAGGNVFQFMMDYKGVSFAEAVEMMARNTSIALPDRPHKQTERESPETTNVHEAYDLVTKLYHHLLLHTDEGKAALAYLTDRGVTKETIQALRLGYAPESWQLTTQFLEKRGFDLALMQRAGLVGFSENKTRYFDRFRHRVMFPIANPQGAIMAFGGRAIGNGDEPKYLNTTETPWFEKGKQLYGFSEARPFIKKEQKVLLMEGNVDVVTAYQAGFKHAIATLGTALTKHQVMLLKRITSQVIICYDADSAGSKAAVRAGDLLVENGLDVRVASLPDNMDPDECIRSHGTEHFKNEVLGNSSTLTAFKMTEGRKGKNLRDEGERLAYIEHVLKDLLLLDSEVEKDHYIRQLSDEFSIADTTLRNEIERLSRQTSFKTEQRETPEREWKGTSRPAVKSQLRPAYENAERFLIAHMLKSADNAAVVYEKLGVAFNLEEHSAIVTYLYAFYEENDRIDISRFISGLKDQRLETLVSELAMLEMNEVISEKELNDYIQQVLNHPEWLMINKKEQQKHDAERRKDFKMAAQIGQEIIDQKRRLKSQRLL
ncbi:DNA primase [Aureibacillus halotolerans]|uniref:DNA primase n=1 Tax=Aureibacillus halotolerans TaxID=1508390 RepID=A0A4R6UF41_9BACI|nr:DNA primase [Aureibacillus halotolerans]TDQ41724.1 DNA primase [Aureibacillus halotolerans]